MTKMEGKWDRYEALMSIKYIDDVYTYQTEKELYHLIKFWKPDIRILGEDFTFQEKARKKGFKSYIDPKVIIGHEKKFIM